MPDSVRLIPASPTRQWLNDSEEIALLDVREAGQFGEGHPFFAVPAPYSQLELLVPALVPRLATRIVLVDAGDGLAGRAAARLQALGYQAVHVLDGGAPAWQAAGYTLFQGVNLPSKTFGELVELAFHTPHLSAADLQQRRERGEAFVLLDGRTPAEHRKMTIPGAAPVPNGELARHWHALAPDPATPIIIHCAGRTRSIIGAQILRSLNVPNPVLALENGTQGWALAGLTLERGSERQPAAAAPVRGADREAAATLADEAGAPRLSADQAQAWIDDEQRTTYVIDVRSREEFAAGSLAGAVHAPGGQLLQATDQTVGVRKARLLLLDDDAVRAPVIAAWLRRMGWEAATVEDGIGAPLRLVASPAAARLATLLPTLEQIGADRLASWVDAQAPRLIDLQASADHRHQHPRAAQWSIRPRLHALDGNRQQPLLLIAGNETLARLAALDLAEAGFQSLAWTRPADWLAAGLPTAATPDSPDDASSIDYLFFVHDRHDGNLDAARRYLAWETGLITQCADDELAVFRLPGRHDDAPAAAA